MIIGIDASNIKSGGGLKHLVQILSYVDQVNLDFDKVIIWSSQITLEKIKDKNIIEKKTNFWINKTIFHSFIWHFFFFPNEIRKNKCDILFLPGSTLVKTNIPIISMNQNLLPFSWNEIWKFGFSFFSIKLLLLRVTQIICFKISKGIIFLSTYSKNLIEHLIDISNSKRTVIPHGIEDDFYLPPKVQKDIKLYSKNNPYKLLYVSHIWPYKNHLNVLTAVSILRKEGIYIEIHLVGGAHKASLKKLNKEILKLDPLSCFVFLHGEIDNVIQFYHHADGFIFGSSCEAYGQILTEAMMSGLPVICSNKSSAPEIVGDAAIYFNPDDLQELVVNLRKFLISFNSRSEIAKIGSQNVQNLTWYSAAIKTFSFISENCK